MKRMYPINIFIHLPAWCIVLPGLCWANNAVDYKQTCKFSWKENYSYNHGYVFKLVLATEAIIPSTVGILSL